MTQTSSGDENIIMEESVETCTTERDFPKVIGMKFSISLSKGKCLVKYYHHYYYVDVQNRAYILVCPR